MPWVPQQLFPEVPGSHRSHKRPGQVASFSFGCSVHGSDGQTAEWQNQLLSVSCMVTYLHLIVIEYTSLVCPIITCSNYHYFRERPLLTIIIHSVVYWQ